MSERFSIVWTDTGQANGRSAAALRVYGSAARTFPLPASLDPVLDPLERTSANWRGRHDAARGAFCGLQSRAIVRRLLAERPQLVVGTLACVVLYAPRPGGQRPEPRSECPGDSCHRERMPACNKWRRPGKGINSSSHVAAQGVPTAHTRRVQPASRATLRPLLAISSTVYTIQRPEGVTEGRPCTETPRTSVPPRPSPVRRCSSQPCQGLPQATRRGTACAGALDTAAADLEAARSSIGSSWLIDARSPSSIPACTSRCRRLSVGRFSSYTQAERGSPQTPPATQARDGRVCGQSGGCS